MEAMPVVPCNIMDEAMAAVSLSRISLMAMKSTSCRVEMRRSFSLFSRMISSVPSRGRLQLHEVVQLHLDLVGDLQVFLQRRPRFHNGGLGG